MGDAPRAREDEEEALALFRQLGQQLNEVIGLRNLGQISLYENDLAQARRHLVDGLALAQRVSSLEEEGECELLLGEVDLAERALGAALEHLARSLEVCREGADKRGEANALARLGALDILNGDYAAARQHLSQALPTFHHAEMWKELVGCLEEFARLAQWADRPEVGVRIAAVATATRQRLGLVRRPATESAWQACLEGLRKPLGDEGFVAAWNEAWDQWESEDAIRSALALPQHLDEAKAP
jgi:tetratricopeptide (TPR) repeat protein